MDTRSGSVADLVSPEATHADAERGLREAGFVTAVRLGERAGEVIGLAEALGETVGAHVRSLGGLGGFSSLSVRGASPGHTAVVIDGVPLARLGSATIDLGRVEASSLSLAALHRGAVPVDHGGAAQASALELHTAVGRPPGGRPLLLSAGVGSFGARHLRARYLGGTADGDLGTHLGVGYAGADGDFLYHDDGGTPLNRSDDRIRTRDNNGYDQVDATARLTARRGRWTLRAGSRSTWKHQGVPGAGSAPSLRTSLTSWSQIADGSAVREHAFGRPELTARAAAHLLVELQRYRDLDGEIGLAAQDRRYLTGGAGARAALDAALGRHLFTAGVEAGLELFSDTDLLQASAPRERGLRLLLAATLADTIRLGPSDRLLLVPAVRADLHVTDPIVDPQDGVPDEMALVTRSELFLSPRLSALLRLAPALSLKASAGRSLRAPTALEMYGDRGYILGNPALRAESGETADLGLVLAPARPAGPIDRVYLEAVGFASRTRDTIVLVPTASLVTGAQNLGDAAVWGAELLASARAARAVTATAHYTILDTRQSDTLPSYEGKELPQRPRHQLHGRLDLAGTLAGRLAVLWGDASLVSGNYLDPANIHRVPDRALLGAGVKLELAAGLLASVEGKNLTDQRVDEVPLDPPPRPDLTSAPRAVSDFFGYPLPGRAFYLTLQWEH
ncbi:MAG TPA: TonB-dependent receptor [Kofleriaceae bacterium]|nr:TonB-dependent receptor [Kofleriaceae bacterium]